MRGLADWARLRVYIGDREAGTVGLFGARKASQVDEKEAGKGLRMVLNITKIVDALHAGNKLDVDALDVRIVPGETNSRRGSRHDRPRQHIPSRTLSATYWMMTRAARERFQITAPILVLSTVAWALVLSKPTFEDPSSSCSGDMLRTGSSKLSLALLTMLQSPRSLAVTTGLMLAAMMLPMLAMPLRDIRDRSFARRRIRSIILFLSAYVCIWMPACAVLVAVAVSLRVLANSSAVLGFGIAIVFLWECSPPDNVALIGAMLILD